MIRVTIPRVYRYRISLCRGLPCKSQSRHWIVQRQHLASGGTQPAGVTKTLPEAFELVAALERL